MATNHEVESSNLSGDAKLSHSFNSRTCAFQAQDKGAIPLCGSNRKDFNMDNKIEISLDSYTALIRENERLKANLTRCYKQMKALVDDNIRQYEISKMTREECIEAKGQSFLSLVDEYAFGDGIKVVLEEWPCFTKADIEAEFGKRIYAMILERLRQLPGDKK